METQTVNNNIKSFGLINANTLRLIACILMLMDHAWATVIPGSDWLTYAGRMAFPIFAFQIAEGFFHTSDFKKYARRLFILDSFRKFLLTLCTPARSYILSTRM